MGFDVDPLSVFISRTKACPLDPTILRSALAQLLKRITQMRRSPDEYEQRKWKDLSDAEWRDELEGLWVPAIPNLEHWFRRYVVTDLARLLALIDETCRGRERAFFRLIFASCIRNASNADPVPVSGLEVTKHMRALDQAGRVVDPFQLFETRSRRAIDGMAEFYELHDPAATVRCRRADATRALPKLGTIDAVITSPPYHGAVDYYRRHQLEQFWLGLVTSQSDRLTLLDDYLGRPKVPARHRFVKDKHPLPQWASDLEGQIAQQDPERARAFRHYCVGMSKSLQHIASTIKPGGRAIFVVGHSRWKDTVIDTSRLFSELSEGALTLLESRWYPVTNRYMSYQRHNGASIDKEYVLVYEAQDSV